MKSLLYEHASLRFSVGEKGDGTPMIFQHGLCGDAFQPAEVFPTGEGWRCLTLECRGHGHSEPGAPENFSIAIFADDLASFIQSQELAPVAIGGISMGAAIALRLTVRHRELVRALVLARPAWLTESAPANMRPNALVGELLRQYSADEAKDRFEASDVARDLAQNAPDNLTSLRSFFSRQPIEVTRELLCRISEDGPKVTREEVASIDVPTLVIGHALDFVHPLAMAQSLAALIPGAKLAEITPKAANRDSYRSDFRTALSTFLRELPL